MINPVAQFALLSDAAQLAVTGAGFWLLAGLSAAMDYRRNKQRDVDRLEQVGWVPWTAMFLGSAVIGGGILALSVPAVLGSL